MPCSEKRARKLMDKKQAIPYYQKGIFCIRLLKEPSSRKYQEIALGIDPGSKREGYTVATEKSVVLNITTNTPAWVKGNVETRRMLRRNRRSRKAPYRACRSNRRVLKKNRIPPSTKARWDTKLRIIKKLLNILPITVINVEDIKTITKEGKKKWNTSFSPLEVGKSWFYSEIEKLGARLIKTEGKDTKAHRDNRAFKKTKAKLEYIWTAHNVDSHSLAEMALNKQIKTYLGLYKIEFMQFHRRQTNIQNPAKGNIRKPYGTTVSCCMSRGSVVRYQNKLAYLGGSSKGMVAIHSIITGKRVKQFVDIKATQILYNNKQRTQFLPSSKEWTALGNYYQ